MVKFSATAGTGTQKLQQALISKLETGPYYYPPDLVTDQPETLLLWRN